MAVCVLCRLLNVLWIGLRSVFVFVQIIHTYYFHCGHLLGKGSGPLALFCGVSCTFVTFPGSDVILHCIESRSLSPYLLLPTVYVTS